MTSLAFSTSTSTTLLPMVVLEELDKIKDRNKDVSREARVAIRSLEEALKEARPDEIIDGVKLSRMHGEHNAQGTLAIFPDYQLEQKSRFCNYTRMTTVLFMLRWKFKKINIRQKSCW